MPAGSPTTATAIPCPCFSRFSSVTVSGIRHELERPLFVLATQNPIEQEGTYPLPEAQLDRFMFMTLVKYPTPSDEVQIMKQATSSYVPSLSRLLDGEKILQLQQIVRRMPVADHVYAYARDLVREQSTVGA